MVSSSSEHSWAVGEKKCVTNNEYNQKRMSKSKDVDSKSEMLLQNKFQQKQAYFYDNVEKVMTG